MAKMTDSELLTICRRESYAAETYVTSEISEEREDAMKRYLGEEYGDETAGRSKVVSRDVLETVEWIMPSLLRIFASGDDVVSYAPETPQDVEFAEQATDLANVVFYKDNNGFLILNTWLKDSLISKMGILKSYWDEQEVTTTSAYNGLSEGEFIALVTDDAVEVVEHTETMMDGREYVEDDDIFEKPLTFHDVKITRTSQRDRIKILPIPPEEFYMSFDAADPDDATYLEHRASKTRTSLILDGFSKKLVESLPGDDTHDPTGEKQTRSGTDLSENADEAMSEVTVHESYVYADVNGDDVAEWTRVLWCGNEILEQDEVDSQPFHVICPVPVPHRAYGLSLADLVMDLERIRTVILRQTLDSLYLANNPEREVDVNLIVDMDDFLMSRPGGIKRVEKIGASREISYPFVGQASFAMLDGLDGMMAKRTGVSDMTMGVDAEVLANQTATASNNAVAAKNQRVEMIARIFAETGIKSLFKRILRLLVENQTEGRMLKIRNNWVEISASGWSPDMAVTIDVGLGHGNRDQQMGHLNNILMWQKELLSSGGLGIVTPKHVYNTMERMLTTIGFRNTDKFIADPGDGEMQQPEQPNPQAELIQAQMQIEKMKTQAAAQKAQADNAIKDQQMKLDHHVAMQRLEIDTEKLDVEREKIAASMNETAARIRSDEAKAGAMLDAKADMELARIHD